MTWVFPPRSSGGSGTVTSVTAADTSIVVAGSAAAPTIATNTLDVIATVHAPAAAWSNNSKKITSLANGSGAQDAAAFGQIPTALPPNGSAGGVLSGTYPNPGMAAGAAVANIGAAGLPIADIADPTTGKVIGSVSNAAAAVFPPGFELDYVQITSNASVTGTSSAAASTVITGTSRTYDGAPVLIQFFANRIASGTTSIQIVLYDGATQLGLLWNDAGATTQTGCSAFTRITPSAGTHQYIIKAFVDAGTGTVLAGDGTLGVVVPAFLRISKV